MVIKETRDEMMRRALDVINSADEVIPSMVAFSEVTETAYTCSKNGDMASVHIGVSGAHIIQIVISDYDDTGYQWHSYDD